MTNDGHIRRNCSDHPESEPSQPRPAQAQDSADDAGLGPVIEPVEPADQADVVEMDSQIQSLEEELGQMKDRALRLQAELENYRKRVSREAADQRRYGDLALIREILPVLDNMQRAIEAAEKSGEAPGLLDGFKMVVQQMEGVLDRHHCTPIKALHEAFDPNLHEAISQQPAADYPPNTVIYVVRTGYLLHDRVVRPTQAIVSAPVVAAPNT